MPYIFDKKFIDKNSVVPLYYQLFLHIDSQIKCKNLVADEILPTEKNLCDFYNISRATVRQAMSLLKNNKSIYKIQGIGSFIAENSIDQSLEKFYSFSDEVKKQGKSSESKFIKQDLLNKDDEIKNKLNLDYNQLYYKIERLRLVDGKPALYETTFLPANRFVDIDVNKIIEQGLYNYLQSSYNFHAQKAIENLSACKLDKRIANYLDAKAGDASLCIERYTYEDEKVVEYSQAFAKNNMIKFSKSWDLKHELRNI